MIVITQKAGTLGIFKTVVEKEDRLVCDGRLEFPFVAIGAYEISEDDSLMPQPVPVVSVPAAVTMRQARLALLQAGKLSAVNAAIAGMSGVQGDAARIEWEFSNEVQRAQPLVAALAPVIGMSSAQLDQLFITAAGL